MMDGLVREIEELEVGLDGAALAGAIAAWDRLGAVIALAVGGYDAARAWEADSATSMTAWLRHFARMTSRAAGRLVGMGRRLRQLPHLAAAFADGTLSAGQVEAVLAALSERTLPLFADREAEVVPLLAPLSVTEVARAMAVWQERAQAEAPEPEPPRAPERSLHCSPTLDGRVVLDGDLDPEGGAVVAAALGLAATGDAPGEPARSPATRRADALVDLCRFFLDHHRHRPSARTRPHLNVVVGLDELVAGRRAEVVGGPRLDGTALSRLACDSVLRRVVVDGAGAIVDYGRATRTVPGALWNALLVRDRHCRFPSCDRPAAWCEAHHVVWFSRGGPTALTNLVLCCSRHHHRLHEPGWEAKLRPDGTFVVTEPNGWVRTTRPPGLRQ
jgi:hypothetical protein